MSNETAKTAPASGAPANKQALLEAFDSVLKKQAEDREAEQREVAARRQKHTRIRPTVGAAALLVLFLCAYLAVERPEWLFPSSTLPESVAIQEASLRIGMANLAQHVERHRQRTGSLPRTLLDAGTQAEGIIYQPLDSLNWRMVGSQGDREVTLTSSEPLGKFVGNSFEVISRRGR